jgi:primary-amine oxidase
MIDGLSNSVVETDIVPSPHPTGHPLNHAGNAFTTSATTLSIPSEGGRAYNASTDRRWTIVNPARRHYASGDCVGYQIDLRGATQDVLAKEDSWVVKRAPFLKKAVWVVKDNEKERNWPAGKYVPQTYVTFFHFADLTIIESHV